MGTSLINGNLSLRVRASKEQPNQKEITVSLIQFIITTTPEAVACNAEIQG